MAKPKFPPPSRRILEASKPRSRPVPPPSPEEPKETESLRSKAEDEELPSGPERIAPSEGQPREAVPVILTETDLRALADEFSSEIQYQLSAQETFRSNIRDWLKLYRAKSRFGTKNYPLAHASNVTVALAAIYTDQVVARIMQALWQPQPHWVAESLNRKFSEHVKPYERYLDWSRKNTWDQWRVVKPFVQDIAKLGTGIIYNDWVNETLYHYDDKQQQTIAVGTRSGPRPRWIPREDFLMPVGFSDLQTAPWIAHRPWFSWDALERMSHAGAIENLDKLKSHSDDEDDTKLERRKNRDAMATTEQDDRFGLWAPWYVWFRRDLDRDGWPEEYVMMLHTETRTILRAVANPSPLGTRPYVAAKFIEVEGEFDGIGIPEQVESLQEEASTIHNQRRDRAHLANIVMYKKRAAATSIPETIRPESGKTITVLDMNDLQEFHPSTNVSIDAFEEDFVRKLASERVGMSDIDMSRMSSPMGRAAATTVMALMQEGSRRFDLNVTDIRGALTEQGHQLTELWQIYGLPQPEESGSPEQVLDDKEAALVRELLQQRVGLRGLVSIQLNMATAAINKEVEKRSNIELYGIVQGYLQQVSMQIAPLFLNPQVPPEMKQLLLHGVKGLDKLLTRVFQAHSAFDLETVLAGDLLEEMGMKAQQAQQQGMMGGQPGTPGQQQDPRAMLQMLAGGKQ